MRLRRFLYCFFMYLMIIYRILLIICIFISHIQAFINNIILENTLNFIQTTEHLARRRSQSADGKRKWLAHTPKETVNTGTVLQVWIVIFKNYCSTAIFQYILKFNENIRLQKSLYIFEISPKRLILTVTFRRSNICQNPVILHDNKAKILSRFLELGLPNAAAQAQQLFIFS